MKMKRSCVIGYRKSNHRFYQVIYEKLAQTLKGIVHEKYYSKSMWGTKYRKVKCFVFDGAPVGMRRGLRIPCRVPSASF